MVQCDIKLIVTNLYISILIHYYHINHYHHYYCYYIVIVVIIVVVIFIVVAFNFYAMKHYEYHLLLNFFVYQLRPSRGNMKIVHKTFNVHKTFSKHIQEGKSWVIKRARSYMNI